MRLIAATAVARYGLRESDMAMDPRYWQRLARIKARPQMIRGIVLRYRGCITRWKRRVWRPAGALLALPQLARDARVEGSTTIGAAGGPAPR
jgi:hypothetical protein